MIVKEVLDEELMTLAEVKESLNKIMEERSDRGEELGYELRKSINHAEVFSKISADKSRELINNLLELEKIKPEIAVKIADILPETRDEVRAIYSKERYTLSEQELDQILNTISETLE